MAGGPLSFKTALQSVTAQSTMETELISMALVSKEVVYLSHMMTELGFGNVSTAYHSSSTIQALYTLRATVLTAHARNTSPYDSSVFKS